MGARIKELTEEAKIAIRNVRRDGNKSADQEQKDKLLPKTTGTRSRTRFRS